MFGASPWDMVMGLLMEPRPLLLPLLFPLEALKGVPSGPGPLRPSEPTQCRQVLKLLWLLWPLGVASIPTSGRVGTNKPLPQPFLTCQPFPCSSSPASLFYQGPSSSLPLSSVFPSLPPGSRPAFFQLLKKNGLSLTLLRPRSDLSLYMQNTKSYEDLKAELGNSGDWGQITAVSTGPGLISVGAR